MWVNLPGKSNAAAVAHAVAKDLARHDLVGLEDCDELLPGVSTMLGFQKR